MKKITLNGIRKILVCAIWLGLILYCLFNYRNLTLDAIVNYSPENAFVAVIVMLFLFAIKSIVFFIYGGLLYAACGVIFPLPLAIAVNTLGTIIMCSVPYFIGKMAGSRMVTSLFDKHPKLQIIKEIQEKNEFLVSFMARIVGVLPADVVSMYLGASLVGYDKYFFGSVLGLFPSIVSFAIMGMSVDNVTSPSFIFSALFELILMAVSIIFVFLWRRRRKK